ncbi:MULTISPECIES: MATE family efflux transporter [Megasphaera]|uniref:Probable multidrug resistance protein NorM n=1 Tax=Megasphaera vaginalis (ex Srinivasan et al. 2021) TaxID=1111454 RepID=U7UL44_9FIRM|nr:MULTISPECIES: MATE family efflux transporter [Megasphaera]ERT59183.1 MATE efflux family protein [Megasphaera vaginalis (ex Srinivasan et al. 2021)]
MYVRSQKTDMLHGSIWDKLILFALPLALTALLEQLFNVADVAVLGQFVGKEAVAAVGNNLALIALLVNLFIGLALGSNVVIARHLGGRRPDLVRQAVHTSWLLAVAAGFVLMLIGQLITTPVLTLLAVPGEVRPMAETYLRIYLLSLPFISLYNFEAAIFRSRGNTQSPLAALLVSVAVNGVLNFLFVTIFADGVAGVAWATVLAMALSAGILFICLLRDDSSIRLEWKKLGIQKALLQDIVQIGWPAALQGMVFCLSNILIQEAVNSLGPDVMAACSIGITIEMAVYCIIVSFAQASTTFISQNFGAGKLRRCMDIMTWALALDILFTLAVCGTVYFFSRPLVGLFNSDPQVAELTIMRIKWVLTLEFIQIFIDVFAGIMRGYGYSLPPAVLTMIGVCGVRITWIYTIFAWEPTYFTLILAYPVSWTVTGVLMTIEYGRFRKHLIRRRHVQRLT